MNANIRSEIKKLIVDRITEKLTNYNPETENMPFFEAIFDKKTIVTASIMQSLYTSFGMSIYEQIAVILAKAAGYKAERQYDLLGSIDKDTEGLINSFFADPNYKHNKNREIELIRKSIKKGNPFQDPEKRVDVFIVNNKGEEIYIDITTVKPNIKEFRALKRKMLRWCALRFSIEPKAKIKTFIGIPYNPNHPKKYDRWCDCYDPIEDIRVQNDLWFEFAGYDVFDELMAVFKEVGNDTKSIISDFFKRKI